MMRRFLLPILLTLWAVPVAAQRPAVHTTIQTTSTAASSLLVGCALGVSTGCTGGINSGPIVVNSGGINIVSNVPGDTSMKLYNNAGTLFFNGVALATGSSVSGTVQFLPYFTSASSIGNSILEQNVAATEITVNGRLVVDTTQLVTGVATFTAAPVFSALTASLPVFTDASKNAVSVGVTGSLGAVVLSVSPSLTTPNLGTPSAVTLTNGTGLPLAGLTGGSNDDIAQRKAGVWTNRTMAQLGSDLASQFSSNAIPWVVVNKTGSSLADLATRSASDLNSGTLADARLEATINVVTEVVSPLFTGNLTGNVTGNVSGSAGSVAVGGITGLGTGVATALAVNTGSAGAFVLFNGALGTPSSGTLTNATGLPVSSGISGLGTGIATALAINVGSAGAPVLFNGAGGTPSSIVLTNATSIPAGQLTGTVADARLEATINVATALISPIVGVGTATGANAALEVARSTGEVFRADASGGAFRIIADQTGVQLGGTTVTLTGALTSSVSVALTGTTNNVGTITTGVWNAGAVTSSGTIAGVAGNFSGAVTSTASGSTFTTDLKVLGAQAGSATLYLWADAGDDNADKWRIEVADGGDLTYINTSGGNAFSLTASGAPRFNDLAGASAFGYVCVDPDGDLVMLESVCTPSPDAELIASIPSLLARIEYLEVQLGLRKQEAGR